MNDENIDIMGYVCVVNYWMISKLFLQILALARKLRHTCVTTCMRLVNPPFIAAIVCVVTLNKMRPYSSMGFCAFAC